MKELTPGVSRVAMLYNPSTSPGGRNAVHTRSIDAAVRSFGLVVVAAAFGTTAEIENAFATFARDHRGVIVIPDTSTTLHSRFVAAPASRYRVPAVYPYSDFVNVGGLLVRRTRPSTNWLST